MLRMKMSPEDRAKQFMPFAALKGYEEALREKERIIVPKCELSEERMEDLNWKLRKLQKQDMVTVVYFHEGQYLKMTGMVSRLDVNARVLTIVNTKISFADLFELEFCEK